MEFVDVCAVGVFFGCLFVVWESRFIWRAVFLLDLVGLPLLFVFAFDFFLCI